MIGLVDYGIVCLLRCLVVLVIVVIVLLAGLRLAIGFVIVGLLCGFGVFVVVSGYGCISS